MARGVRQTSYFDVCLDFCLFCLTCQQLNTLPCFLCRVTRESGACPHIILFKRKGRTKAKSTEQAPMPCALCHWSCHPNLPCVGNVLFLGDLGKSGAGWNCQSLTLFVPVFGDLFSFLFSLFGDVVQDECLFSCSVCSFLEVELVSLWQ